MLLIQTIHLRYYLDNLNEKIWRKNLALLFNANCPCLLITAHCKLKITPYSPTARKLHQYPCRDCAAPLPSRRDRADIGQTHQFCAR